MMYEKIASSVSALFVIRVSLFHQLTQITDDRNKESRMERIKEFFINIQNLCFSINLLIIKEKINLSGKLG
jgi:hypothetical protein